MSNRQKINDKRVSRRPSQIVKEGFLTKQGHVVKNWKMRWFVLKEDGSLEYFASPKEKTPLGRIKITKDMRIQVNDATKIKPNCFLLHCARKPFLLVADTNDAKLEWIKAINNIIYDPFLQFILRPLQPHLLLHFPDTPKLVDQTPI